MRAQKLGSPTQHDAGNDNARRNRRAHVRALRKKAKLKSSLLRWGWLTRLWTTTPLNETSNDAALREIIRRDLHNNFVTRKHADVEFSHLAGEMGEHLMAVITLHTECVREALLYYSVKLNRVL